MNIYTNVYIHTDIHVNMYIYVFIYIYIYIHIYICIYMCIMNCVFEETVCCVSEIFSPEMHVCIYVQTNASEQRKQDGV